MNNLTFSIEGTFRFEHYYELNKHTGWTKEKAEQDFKAFFKECIKECSNKYGMSFNYNIKNRVIEED